MIIQQDGNFFAHIFFPQLFPSSTNVIDLRGKDMGTYIDANGACWAPGTPSIIMYPGGSGPSYSMSSSTSSANSGS
ncbi:hypothetical protein GC658_24255 [Escherichia coli]|nr:hypothetical protein [Escherichia coli]